MLKPTYTVLVTETALRNNCCIHLIYEKKKSLLLKLSGFLEKIVKIDTYLNDKR